MILGAVLVCGFATSRAAAHNAPAPAGEGAVPAIQGPMRFGRLVDVRAVDPATQRSVDLPALHDVFVGESAGVSLREVATEGGSVSLALAEDAVAGLAILTIGAPFEGEAGSPFQRALAAARASAGAIAPAAPGSLPPFPEIPANAAVEMTFDAPLDGRSIGADAIAVRAAGDAGVAVAGRFVWNAASPTKLVFDPTISAGELARVEAELAAGHRWNAHVRGASSSGFPSGDGTGFDVAITLASQGRTLHSRTQDSRTQSSRTQSSRTQSANGSAAASAAPYGAQRAFRVARGSGSWLASTTPFSVVGSQPMDVLAVGDSTPGSPGNDGQRLTVRFQIAACDFGVSLGDTLEQSGNFANVVNVVSHAGDQWVVDVNYLQGGPFLVGRLAILSTLFSADPNKMAKAACFLILRPEAAIAPATGFDPRGTVALRFSKAFDMATVDPLENLSVVLKGGVDPTTAGQKDVAVAKAYVSPGDPTSLVYVPLLPLPHVEHQSEVYRFFVLGGAKGIHDVDGNPLAFGTLDFQAQLSMLRTAPSFTSKNLTLRFDSILEGGGPQQLVIGQVTAPAAGEISGRPVSQFSRYADPSNPFVGIMTPFNLAGVQTPLVPLGSREMILYRHMDVNLSINSLADLDLDVTGLSWSVFPQVPVTDFYPHIRIDAAHANRFPDEFVNAITFLPEFPISGLSTTSFATNILDAANHPEKMLYEGSYTVNANQVFTAPSGMKMIPYPAFSDSYTWRDSSFSPLALGGANGNGVNPKQYFTVLGLPVPTGNTALHPYLVAQVPSVASPLLFDFRTYPSSDPGTLGLNGYRVALACTSSSKPNFRVFSSGGLNTLGNPVQVVPDVAPLGTIPSGGFYPPGSTQGTPGTKTPPDGPEFYMGRVDFAVKHSRVYTHYFDLGEAATMLANEGVVTYGKNPAGTSVALAYRGADSVSSSLLGEARCFDAYGNPYVGTGTNTVPPPTFGGPFSCGTETGAAPAKTFTNDLGTLSGKRFLLLRITFSGDIATLAAPTLTSLGVAYVTPTP